MEIKKVILTIIFLVQGAMYSSFGQNIDPLKSEVKFSIDNFKIKTVTGSFKGLTGEISFDEQKLGNASMNVCIPATSINTENKKRDEHLRTEDFFDVETYPLICFESKKIEKKEEGYIVTGNLTLHGITKEITIPFNYDHQVFKGETSINRIDYKVGGNSTFTVGNEVRLSITCKLEE
ncbi:YceI family protein [Flammeovirga sp. SJP92]|uniref:YceI family protein n=1 Tax=Flammeovirga sp. SJP92 TaxID=1775430 RepID=UPI0007891516|nr:YceI family protein [Flammeovirga sp. SJP92]KXX67678.1 hypothetical protein AVL50_24710 [Flammeovirga sp. SJP92]